MNCEPITIFGGTFDPVHFGHLRAATEVKEQLGVSDFRLLPAGQPPHRDATFAGPQHRLAMLRLAIADHPDFQVDEREVLRGGASYMVDTLADFRQEAASCPLVLTVGQDAMNKLDGWHQWRRLFELAHIAVMTRPNAEHSYSTDLAREIDARRTSEAADILRQPAGRIIYLKVTQLAISSTNIRQQIQAGGSPRFLLPDRILSYIDYHKLYRPQA